MQPGYPQPGQPATIITTQPTTIVTTAVVVPAFRENPAQVVCPHCQAQIITATHFETGTLTWLMCGVLCILGYVASAMAML